MGSRDEKYLKILEGIIEDPKDCPYYGPKCTKRIKAEIKQCEKCPCKIKEG